MGTTITHTGIIITIHGFTAKRTTIQSLCRCSIDWLARAGYYHGPIDGVMEPRTRAAIRAYERTHGLRVDGAVSQQLLVTMGLRY